MKDSHAIAEDVLRLKSDEGLRRKIAKGGYSTFKYYCSPSALGKELRHILFQNQQLLSGKEEEVIKQRNLI